MHLIQRTACRTAGALALALAILAANPAQATFTRSEPGLFGEFYLAEANATVFDLDTFPETMQIDIWKFRLTNNTSADIFTLGLAFNGNFIPGPTALSSVVSIPQPTPAFRFAGSLIGGPGTPPFSTGVLHTSSNIIAGDLSVTGAVWLHANSERDVAVFSLPAGAPGLGPDNFTNGLAVINGEIVNIPSNLAGVIGDLNGDYLVDLLDFDIFATDYGKPFDATTLRSDITRDEVIDLRDFDLFARRFLPWETFMSPVPETATPTAAPSAVPAPVPEPATTALLALAGIIARRRRA